MMKLKINGKPYTYEGDTTLPLLWYLRDELNLTGAKYGCGAALCGACTVHVEGEAMRACVLSMAAVAGKSITTIEGLDQSGEHPLQQAWTKHQVPQCGFCQPGQIMQAAALLSANAKPTDAEIETAMQGNICRCGTYLRIHSAIKSVAEQA